MKSEGDIGRGAECGKKRNARRERERERERS